MNNQEVSIREILEALVLKSSTNEDQGFFVLPIKLSAKIPIGMSQKISHDENFETNNFVTT